MRYCITSVNGERIISINRDKFSIAVLNPDSKRTGIAVLCVLFFLLENAFLFPSKLMRPID